jgi:hypothetical protein
MELDLLAEGEASALPRKDYSGWKQLRKRYEKVTGSAHTATPVKLTDPQSLVSEQQRV